MSKTISKVAQGIVQNLYTKQRLLLKLNFEMTDLKHGSLKLKLPYSQLAAQDDNIFQKGVISTLGDVAAGLAACTVMTHSSHSAITVEFKINFLQPAHGPFLLAWGQVIKETKTLIFTQAEIYDSKQNLCAYLYQTIKRVTPEDNPSIKVI